MRLVPFNDYVVRAERFTAENPLGSWKRAFLSTEDPNVIEQMKIMARISPFTYSGSNLRWTWYWSDIPSKFAYYFSEKKSFDCDRAQYQPRDTIEGVWRSDGVDYQMDAAISHGYRM